MISPVLPGEDRDLESEFFGAAPPGCLPSAIQQNSFSQERSMAKHWTDSML
jgi:hypothetical protein